MKIVNEHASNRCLVPLFPLLLYTFDLIAIQCGGWRMTNEEWPMTRPLRYLLRVPISDIWVRYHLCAGFGHLCTDNFQANCAICHFCPFPSKYSPHEYPASYGRAPLTISCTPDIILYWVITEPKILELK